VALYLFCSKCGANVALSPGFWGARWTHLLDIMGKEVVLSFHSMCDIKWDESERKEGTLHHHYASLLRCNRWTKVYEGLGFEKANLKFSPFLLFSPRSLYNFYYHLIHTWWWCWLLLYSAQVPCCILQYLVRLLSKYGWAQHSRNNPYLPTNTIWIMLVLSEMRRKLNAILAKEKCNFVTFCSPFHHHHHGIICIKMMVHYVVNTKVKRH